MVKEYKKADVRQALDDFLRISQVVIGTSSISANAAEILASFVAILAGTVSVVAENMEESDVLVSNDDPPQLF